MRAVVQRVSAASVGVDGEVRAAVGRGLLVLLGIARADGAAEAERLAARVARLRIFENEAGRFDRSLLDTGGAALVVSQFTLIADSRWDVSTGRIKSAWRGNRPSFSDAAPPEQAERLYQRFIEELRALGVPVETGVFGARMEVDLVNDGPVTVIVDT